jgi:hypothetical protein
MSELTQAGIVILLTVLGVLLLNAAILIMVRGRRPGSEIEVMRRLGSAARQPFAKSDSQFEELSRLVKDLEGKNPTGAPAADATPGEREDNANGR